MKSPFGDRAGRLVLCNEIEVVSRSDAGGVQFIIMSEGKCDIPNAEPVEKTFWSEALLGGNLWKKKAGLKKEAFP
jgi:hypothetical protein